MSSASSTTPPLTSLPYSPSILGVLKNNPLQRGPCVYKVSNSNDENFGSVGGSKYKGGSLRKGWESVGEENFSF